MLRQLVLFFAMVSTAAWAEVAIYQGGGNSASYEAVATLTFSVDHPFRFVRGEISYKGGLLLADMAQPSAGMKLDLAMPAQKVATGDRMLDAAISKIMLESQNPDIEYHSTGTVIEESAFPRLNFSFVGYLTIAGTTRLFPLPLKCVNDDKFLQCTVQTSFPLSDFNLNPPTLFGVSARDRVLLRGEIVFKPKG